MQKWFDYARTMKEGLDIAHAAARIGVRARANMLTALMNSDKVSRCGGGGRNVIWPLGDL